MCNSTRQNVVALILKLLSRSSYFRSFGFGHTCELRNSWRQDKRSTLCWGERCTCEPLCGPEAFWSSYRVGVWVCVGVCERERERERENLFPSCTCVVLGLVSFTASSIVLTQLDRIWCLQQREVWRRQVGKGLRGSFMQDSKV